MWHLLYKAKAIVSYKKYQIATLVLRPRTDMCGICCIRPRQLQVSYKRYHNGTFIVSPTTDMCGFCCIRPRQVKDLSDCHTHPELYYWDVSHLSHKAKAIASYKKYQNGTFIVSLRTVVCPICCIRPEQLQVVTSECLYYWYMWLLLNQAKAIGKWIRCPDTINIHFHCQGLKWFRWPL